mmetsp:Transcript_19716/g.62710  ORF Transcript_19716/g.62710 Transcript_19716/m.62710 type:complete len:340 (+) Transcript_19716:550-1569(+)
MSPRQIGASRSMESIAAVTTLVRQCLYATTPAAESMILRRTPPRMTFDCGVQSDGRSTWLSSAYESHALRAPAAGGGRRVSTTAGASSALFRARYMALASSYAVLSSSFSGANGFTFSSPRSFPPALWYLSPPASALIAQYHTRASLHRRWLLVIGFSANTCTRTATDLSLVKTTRERRVATSPMKMGRWKSIFSMRTVGHDSISPPSTPPLQWRAAASHPHCSIILRVVPPCTLPAMLASSGSMSLEVLAVEPFCPGKFSAQGSMPARVPDAALSGSDADIPMAKVRGLAAEGGSGRLATKAGRKAAWGDGTRGVRSLAARRRWRRAAARMQQRGACS